MAERIILVAYDGTAAAEQAFAMALEIAHSREARMHVIAVASVVEVETHVIQHRLHCECEACLQPLRGRCAEAGVDVELEICEGARAREIVAAARRVGAELIVIGHRQRSLWRRCLEPSVAKRVLDRAPCGVLVAH